MAHVYYCGMRLDSTSRYSWPCAPRLSVGRDCGLLPLALAIAGSMAVVKGRGRSAQAWLELHSDLDSKTKMLMARGGTRTSIHHVLDSSFDQLGASKQRMFLRVAVLAKGASAPEDMLTNLWEVEVSMGLVFLIRVYRSCVSRSYRWPEACREWSALSFTWATHYREHTKHLLVINPVLNGSTIYLVSSLQTTALLGTTSWGYYRTAAVRKRLTRLIARIIFKRHKYYFNIVNRHELIINQLMTIGLRCSHIINARSTRFVLGKASGQRRRP